MSDAPRRLRVDARALFDALTARDASVLGSYLDLRTGAVFQLLDPVLTGGDNESIEAAMDQEPTRYASIPTYDREYRLMCAFAEEVEDEDLAAALDQALRGGTAFRAFHALLGSYPTVTELWAAYRQQALVRWAVAWLRTLGFEPDWELPTVGPMGAVLAHDAPRLGLHHLLLLGGDRPDVGADGTLRRTIIAASASEARVLFKRFARQLCDYRGEPWRSRYVRDLDSFERDGVRLRQDGERVDLEVVLQRDLLVRFGIPAS